MIWNQFALHFNEWCILTTKDITSIINYWNNLAKIIVIKENYLSLLPLKIFGPLVCLCSLKVSLPWSRKALEKKRAKANWYKKTKKTFVFQKKPKTHKKHKQGAHADGRSGKRWNEIKSWKEGKEGLGWTWLELFNRFRQAETHTLKLWRIQWLFVELFFLHVVRNINTSCVEKNNTGIGLILCKSAPPDDYGTHALSRQHSQEETWLKREQTFQWKGLWTFEVVS